MTFIRVALPGFLIAALLATPTPALAQTCLDTIKRHAVTVSVDARVELARQRDVQETFDVLRQLVRRWKAATYGTYAQKCLLGNQRFLLPHGRFVRMNRKPFTLIVGKIDKYCREFGPFLIDRLKQSIERAYRKRELRLASLKADELDTMLTTKSMFKFCKPLRGLVSELRTRYLPGVRGRMRIPNIAAELGARYEQLRGIVDSSQGALAGKATALRKLAAGMKTSAQRRVVTRSLRYCLSGASLLRRLGGTSGTKVGTLELARVEQGCRRVHENAATLADLANKYNVALAARSLKRWKNRSIYGGGMWRVFRRYGRPQVERKLRRGVVWTYRIDGRCLRIRFSQSGRIAERGRSVCPAVARASTP